MPMTPVQAHELANLSEREKIAASSFGLGTDGYPPTGQGIWVLLEDGRTLTIDTDGSQIHA